MKVHESFFRDVLRLVVWYPFRWLITALPAAWGIRLLMTMGDAHAAFSQGGTGALLDNCARLRTGSGEAGPSGTACVREYYRNHYVDHLLIFIFPRFGMSEIEDLVEIEGGEFLDKALAGGNGVVLVHGHFGPVHLPLVVLARLGYLMKQIGLPSDEGLSWVGRNVAFRLRLKYEAQIPAEIIKADGFLRSAFRWLNSNGIIMITGDGSGTGRRVGRHEVFRFFGHPVQFPLGPAILADKTGAAIMPLVIVPGESKQYRIIIEPPLHSAAAGEAKLRDVTGQFVKRLEYHVSRFPGWMHFLDRFSVGQLIEKEPAEQND